MDDDDRGCSSAESCTSFATAMNRLRDCQWYWGPISWKDAERVLHDRPIGTFLIRDSASERYIFTLSFRTPDGCVHARVPQHGGRFCFGGPGSLVNAESMVDFVHEMLRRRDIHMLMHPKGELQQAVGFDLHTPISRLVVMPTLKHRCRFAIVRCLASIDDVDQLPVPIQIRHYLQDPKYLVADLSTINL